MTPQEKSLHLVKRFINHSLKESEMYRGQLVYTQFNSAKQCALIAVDEIIDELNFLWIGVGENPRVTYFKEVKSEIEKL